MQGYRLIGTCAWPPGSPELREWKLWACFQGITSYNDKTDQWECWRKEQTVTDA
jgi:hypothetical protein